MSAGAAIPNFIDTRYWFYGKQFPMDQGGEQVVWNDSGALHLLCILFLLLLHLLHLRSSGIIAQRLGAWSGVKVTQLCLTLCYPMDYSLWDSPGQNTGMGSLSLLQGIFPTQGLNPNLPHCRQILYQLSHKGSPRILEWVAYPFSSEFSGSRNRTRVSCIAGRFFIN